jgi:uncharacterized cupin superfamily protein
VEPYSGLFVSPASAQDWQPDPDVPGTDMRELVHADGLWAGFTRYVGASGPVTWTPERREVAFVLEGSVRIEFPDGSEVELGPGDLFSVPPGVQTTWHITAPFKELWVLASD